MTKQQVRDEMKNQDGDPQMKGRRREAHRKLAAARDLSAVADADVVLTNPTHFSVALKYDPDTMPAPQVVAKGADEVAFRIRETGRGARRADPGTARLSPAGCWRDVKVGQTVPPDLYGALVEVMAFVYRLTGKAAAEASRAPSPRRPVATSPGLRSGGRTRRSCVRVRRSGLSKRESDAMIPPRCGIRLWWRGLIRDVAQPGSALDWGSRGRRFESCHPESPRRDVRRGVFIYPARAEREPSRTPGRSRVRPEQPPVFVTTDKNGRVTLRSRPMPATPRVPKLTFHSTSGQARVRLGGRQVYLGKHGSPEATEKYHRLIAEYVRTGEVPAEARSAPAKVAGTARGRRATVAQLPNDRRTDPRLLEVGPGPLRQGRRADQRDRRAEGHPANAPAAVRLHPGRGVRPAEAEVVSANNSSATASPAPASTSGSSG